MKLIYKAGDIIEAHIISGLLEAEGIDAHVSGHYLQGGVGELAPAGFANIHVADEDIESAKVIIDAYELTQDNALPSSTPETSLLHIKVITFGLIAFFIFFIYILTK